VKVGVDARTISRLENGENAPREDTLINLAGVLCSAEGKAQFIALGREAQEAEKQRIAIVPTNITRKERQNLLGLTLTVAFSLTAPHVVTYVWQQRKILRHEISLALDGTEIYRAILSRQNPLIAQEFMIERAKAILLVERMALGIGLEKQHLLVGGIALFTKPSPPYFLERQLPPG
jgi:transcriptional regulator with XRE-family HTH domain